MDIQVYEYTCIRIYMYMDIRIYVFIKQVGIKFNRVLNTKVNWRITMDIDLLEKKIKTGLNKRFKDDYHKKVSLFVIALMILAGIVSIILAADISGFKGFLFSIFTMIILTSIFFLIWRIKNERLFTYVIFIYALLAAIFQMHLLQTFDYCQEPIKPFWSHSFSSTNKTYYGVPLTLKYLYSGGYNPCDIPVEYFFDDYYERNKYK